MHHSDHNAPYFSCSHLFFCGLFIPIALFAHMSVVVVVALVLIIFFGNWWLPIALAIILDISFADERALSNMYGTLLTASTVIGVSILYPLRKRLKI